MGSNNLEGARIGDNQTSGQNRTANDALNTLDAAISATGPVDVDDTNARVVAMGTLSSYFRFLIGALSPPPTADVQLTIGPFNHKQRGLTLWKNDLSYPATLEHSDGQTEPAVVIPPGAMVLVDFDSENVRWANKAQPFHMVLPVGDEATAITAGTGKLTFRMPARVWLTEVRASLKTAQATGSIFTVDINEGGVSLLSTKITIDNTEKTSKTAVAAPVISDKALADDAEITIDVDQVGDGTAVGLKITLIGISY